MVLRSSSPIVSIAGGDFQKKWLAPELVIFAAGSPVFLTVMPTPGRSRLRDWSTTDEAGESWELGLP